MRQSIATVVQMSFFAQFFELICLVPSGRGDESKSMDVSSEVPLLSAEPEPQTNVSGTEAAQENEHPNERTNMLTHIKENRANEIFWRNLKSSLLMGFIITIFFVPVCNGTIEDMIFYNVTYYDGDERVVKGLDLATRLGCPDLVSHWPNVVQFVFFTVYSDFGTTMEKAYQGMAGTILAEINIFFLLQLLPDGGKCDSGIVEGHLGLKPSCDEYGYANPDYEQWGWILFIVNNVCVTALISVFNIGLPVKKWFLRWNCLFMMQFGSTDGMVRSHSVLLTTILGCLLALVSMLSRLRMSDLERAKSKIVNGFEVILKDLFSFLESESKPLHEQEIFCGRIKSSVRQLDQQVQCMSTDLDVTWWETLGIFSRGKRSECKKFAKLFSMSIEKRDREGRVEGSFYTVLHLMCHAAEEKAEETTKEKEEFKSAIQDTEEWEKLRKLGDDIVALVKDDFKLPDKKDSKDAIQGKTLWEKLCSLGTDIVALVRDVFHLPPKGGSKEEENCEAIAKRKRHLKEDVDNVEDSKDTDLPKYYSLLACALGLLGEGVVKSPDQEVETLTKALTDGFAATFQLKPKSDKDCWNNAFCDTLVILIAFWAGFFLYKKASLLSTSFQSSARDQQQTTYLPQSRKLLTRVDDAARNVPILQPHRTCTAHQSCPHSMTRKRHPINAQAVPEKDHVRTI